MINNLKKPMAFILLLFFGYYLNAQNKLEITPYIGYNTPLGDFNDFAQNGFDFGLSSDYFFSEKFGIGFDFNQQINNTNNPFDFTRIPNEPSVYSIDKNQNGNWATSTFGIGPVYRFSHKKFTTDIYTKAGLSIINTPKYQTTFNYSELGLEKDLLTLGNDQNITSFGLTSGIRFNYQISNSISLFVNPQYVYTSAKVDYTYVNIDNAFGVDPNGEPFFSPGSLIEQPAIEEQLDLSYLNINAGVRFTFGGSQNDKTKITSNTEDEKKMCNPAKLLSPLDQQDFYLSEKERPVFMWEDQFGEEPEFYVFKILDEENQIIFKQETKKQRIKHNKNLEQLYENQFNEERKTLRWKVESQFAECGSLESKTQTIDGYSRSVGIQLDFLQVECKQPAFDSLGNVHYTAKICVTNPTGNTSNLIVPNQTFTVTDTSNGMSTNATQISNPNISLPPGVMLVFPLTLVPGEQNCFWVEFARPIGEQQSAFHLNYYEEGYQNLQTEEIAVANLPSCICDVCQDWQIISSNENIGLINKPEGKLRTSNWFQILNADPIQQVKAEIISVEHLVNDEQCYTCTKHEEDMGLIYLGRQFTATGWQNGGKGFNATNKITSSPPSYSYYDDPTNKYYNEVTWISQSNLGQDFSTGNRIIQLFMDFPKISFLDCCESTYKVCVRYSFTDINCQTCDKVICYKYDPSTTSTGGGISTGNGNQSGGVLTLTQLTPKN